MTLRSNFIDLTGERFGKLTVVKRSEVVGQRVKKSGTVWECRCECGNVIHRTTSELHCHKYRNCKAPGCQGGYTHGNPAAHDTYLAYIRNAADRGYTFSIVEDEFVNIVVGPCYICGESLTNCATRDGYEFRYTGLDRIDNGQGYDLDNIAPCCWRDNRGKGEESLEEYKRRLLRTSDFIRAKGGGYIQ